MGEGGRFLAWPRALSLVVQPYPRMSHGITDQYWPFIFLWESSIMPLVKLHQCFGHAWWPLQGHLCNLIHVSTSGATKVCNVFIKEIICGPWTASVACCHGLQVMQIDTWPWSHTCWDYMVLVGPQVCKSNFTFSGYLINWPHMTFDLWWPLTAWTFKGSHTVSIHQFWFQSDFNFSNEVTFTFSANLTTWPQMTSDLDM